MVRWCCWNSKSSFIRIGISLNQGAKQLEIGIHTAAIFKFFFNWKLTNNFNQPITHLDFSNLFSTHNIWDSGNSGWQRCSYVNLGNLSRSMVYFMVITEKNPASHISILKRYNNFKCALRQRWKLFIQSTPKCGWSQLQDDIVIKHCLTLKIT